MQKIRKGDQVISNSGAHKGQRGEVLSMMGDYAKVEGLNMRVKHVKPNPQREQKGEIVKRESKIHLSNLALYNAETGRGGKVGIKTLEDGRKVRYFRETDEVIDV